MLHENEVNGLRRLFCPYKIRHRSHSGFDLRQNPPAGRHKVSLGKTLPGFKMPLESNTSFTPRIKASC